MIVAVKGYLTAKLTAAGVPGGRITDDPERGEWPPPQTPYAELLTEPERLQRDGKRSARGYDDQARQATVWRRLFARELPVRVRLVHRDEASLDGLVAGFLATLERRFEEAAGDQWIRVNPQGVEWGGRTSGAGPRDRKMAVVRIVFEGGVFSSETQATLEDPPGVKTPGVDMA